MSNAYSCPLCGDAAPAVIRDGIDPIAASDKLLHTCYATTGRKKYRARRVWGVWRHLDGLRKGFPRDLPAVFHQRPMKGCFKIACPLMDELDWFILTARDPKPHEHYQKGVFIPVDELGRDLTHLNSTEVRAIMEWTKAKFDQYAPHLPGITKSEVGDKGAIWVKADEFLAAIGTEQYMTRPRPICVRHADHP